MVTLAKKYFSQFSIRHGIMNQKPDCCGNDQGDVIIIGKGGIMQAIKAIYDGVHFKPKEPIPVSGQYEVVITFLEQIPVNPTDDEQDRISIDLDFWKGFDRLVADASEEVLSLEDFPRTKFGRELVIFDDEV